MELPLRGGMGSKFVVTTVSAMCINNVLKQRLLLLQTLEQYCSLFNSTCNNRFTEAGLVLQNSTAVYVHRIDSLWTKTEYCRNVLSANE